MRESRIQMKIKTPTQMQTALISTSPQAAIKRAELSVQMSRKLQTESLH
jgi:hypothetical protein